MIIGAYYFALVDFIEDTCTVPGCDHIRYVEPLVSLMIKIQHYNVGFTAVYASTHGWDRR